MPNSLRANDPAPVGHVTAKEGSVAALLKRTQKRDHPANQGDQAGRRSPLTLPRKRDWEVAGRFRIIESLRVTEESQIPNTHRRLEYFGPKRQAGVQRLVVVVRAALRGVQGFPVEDGAGHGVAPLPDSGFIPLQGVEQFLAVDVLWIETGKLLWSEDHAFPGIPAIAPRQHAVANHAAYSVLRFRGFPPGLSPK